MRAFLVQILAGLAGLLLTAPLQAQTQRLNDTGQITCYNDSSPTGTLSASTPDPVQPGFERQDCNRGAGAADALGRMIKVGASTAPGRDYTKIANDGSELPASATLGSGPTDWACTRDNVTGLVWEVKTTSGLRSQDHRYSWYDTNSAVNGGIAGSIGTLIFCNGTLANCNTTAYRNAINALTGANRLCGETDWRLPTSSELSGLVHAGLSSGPMIDSIWFPNTRNGAYWTAENYAPDAALAWLVLFNDGNIVRDNKGNFLSVRLVRGGL